MLVEYTYLVPATSAIVERPTIPAQGDAVQVMGAEDGAVYEGTIQAVAEPVFPGAASPWPTCSTSRSRRASRASTSWSSTSRPTATSR
jgi:hypothetical protein